MTDQVITVYVRLCDNNDEDPCREISFKIPEGVSQHDVLERGYAIDGNRVLKQVEGFFDVRSGEGVRLADALRDEQLALMAWLGKLGFSVVFD